VETGQWLSPTFTASGVRAAVHNQARRSRLTAVGHAVWPRSHGNPAAILTSGTALPWPEAATRNQNAYGTFSSYSTGLAI
jgi:hypothetical protein